MKSILSFIMLLCTVAATAQSSKLSELKDSDTTNVIPEGVELKQGKLFVKAGYMTTVSNDKETITVSKRAGGGAGGAGNGIVFNCRCTFTGCGVQVGTDGSISCAKSHCPCSMVVSPSLGENRPVALKAKGTKENNSNKMEWKRLILPN
jgi:hypothetical protein